MYRSVVAPIAMGLILLASCSDSPDGDRDPLGKGGTGGSAGSGGAGPGGSGGSGGDGGDGGAGGEGGGGGTGGDINVGDHLLFWSRGNGVRGPVWSVSSDPAGNLWAANGASLLHLPPGREEWVRFDEDDGLLPYEKIAVDGGRANEVYVGYRGLFPDSDPFDDPPEIALSGGVDRVRLDGGELDRFHYEIFSPPEPAYPQGRYILRTCYRIVPVLSGPWAGDVWFACNHGVAMWNNRFQMVQEHQHSATNADDGSLAVGDFRGLVVSPNGNVWIGGDERSGLIRYGDEGGQFWARIDPEIDIWPRGVALDPGGQDWVMDMIDDGNGGLWVASYGNGAAHMAADGSWSYLTTANGLPDNRVTGLALDPDGSVWIATDAAVARLGSGGFRKGIDGLDGLLGSVLSIHVDRSTSPRRVVIGTSAGIGVYTGP